MHVEVSACRPQSSAPTLVSAAPTGVLPTYLHSPTLLNPRKSKVEVDQSINYI